MGKIDDNESHAGEGREMEPKVEKLEKPWWQLGANAMAGAEKPSTIGVLLGDLEKLDGPDEGSCVVVGNGG